MFHVYAKTADRILSSNLKLSEVACKCNKDRCNYTLFHDLTVYSFQKLRDRAEVPLFITSGYRCQTHNENVGGVPNSFHTLGLAVDIAVPEGYSIFEFSKMASDYFDTVIEYEEENFIHCHNRI